MPDATLVQTLRIVPLNSLFLPMILDPIMKLHFVQFLALISPALGITVTPGGTDYAAINNAITAFALKDSRLVASNSSLVAPTKRKAADPVSVWSAVGTFIDGPAGLATGVILTTGQAASAAPGVAADGSWGYGQDRMTLCPVAPSKEYSMFRLKISAPPGVNGLRVNYLFAEDGRMFQLDAAQVLLSGTTPVPESVVIAKRDPRMKPGVPGANLGLSYEITTGVFSFHIPLESGAQDLTFMVCDRGDSAGDSAVLFNIEGVSSW